MCFIAETLQQAHGNYSASTIDRASVLVGQLSAALDAAFHENVCATEADESYRHRYDYKEDVKAFCVEYRGDQLFSTVPGRQHRAFPDFRRLLSVKDEIKFKRRLWTYCKKLDASRLSQM